MDLHTLASGPVLQDLPIIDGVTSVGRLTFSVEMKEVRAMRVAHREVRMTLDPADDGKVSGPVSLRVWYRNDPAGIRNSVATPFAKMVPEMQRVSVCGFCLQSCSFPSHVPVPHVTAGVQRQLRRHVFIRPVVWYCER